MRVLLSIAWVAFNLFAFSEPQRCRDEMSWCPSYQHLCNSLQYKDQLQTFCRETCDLCGPKASNDTRCSTDNGGCQHICTIQENQLQCECHSGYALDGDGKRCIDVNECLRDRICPMHSKPFCINTVGSYFCTSQSCPTEEGLRNRYQSGDCCQYEPDVSCGKDTAYTRIVGGKNSRIGGWPWMVYVLIDDGILCGGTLLSESWVVTAGHCFVESLTNSSVETFFGRLDPYATPQEEPHVQSRMVDEIILHENWNKDRFPYHDIALMHLETPVQLGTFIDPVCLPNGETPKTGTQCWVTGYGTTAYLGNAADQLQEVDLPVIDIGLCKRTYAESEYPINEDIMFCAGHREGGRDSCQGDSGGPLVCQRCESCSWYLAGVVSFGKGCAEANFYGVYTNVEAHEEWISRKTGIRINKDKSCNQRRITRWGPFGEYEECSQSCNSGQQTRRRTCYNGDPGDQGCIGSETESRSCNDQPCPVWGPYGAFGRCSASCGGGERTRRRECRNGNVGDNGCSGSPTDTEACNSHNCPRWRPYGNYSPCSSSCGGGTRTATRSCRTFGVPGATCEGEATKTEDCNTHKCPSWSKWSSYGRCSASCGGGTRMRTRTCDNGEVGQRGCHVGKASMSQNCNEHICGTWRPWGEWSDCSKTCGSGRQDATRVCSGGVIGEGGCIGRERRRRNCAEVDCPTWDVWSQYGSCSKSCGRGRQTRTRSCSNGNPGQRGCEGEAEEEKVCNTQSCPRWNTWSAWSRCSKTCDGGTRDSSRTCRNGEVGEVGCQGRTRRKENCNPQSCPVWTTYGDWSPCSLTCGGGTRSRRRRCMNGEPGDNGCTGNAEQEEGCSTKDCPYWSEWLSEGTCSKTCGSGKIRQTRQCMKGRVGQDGCNGQGTRMNNCQIRQCPTKWSEWEEFTDCSVTCGSDGFKTRRRICMGPGSNPICPGKASQRMSCGEACKTRWGEWDSWTQCTKTCSGGTRQRRRTCLDGSIGNPGCTPRSKAMQVRACNEELCQDCADAPNVRCTTDINFCLLYEPFYRRNCPKSCNFCNDNSGPWGEWSECTASCDGGTQTRTRRCRTGLCQASMEHLRGCNLEDCSGYTEWSGWSSCTASCEGGTKMRTRECPPNIDCPPDEYGDATRQEERCNERDCPGVWGNWGPYGRCTTSCGEGSRKKQRECNGGSVGGPGCEGSDEKQQDCENDPCPGQWGPWEFVGSCSALCGQGKRPQRRECMGGIVGGPGCTGSVQRQVNCKLRNCVVQWNDWSEFGECSVSCGSGQKTRTRTCQDGFPGDDGCQGDAEDIETCSAEPCPTGPCSSLTDNLVPRPGGPTCQDYRSSCFINGFEAFIDDNCASTCCLERNRGLQQQCNDDVRYTQNCQQLASFRLCNDLRYSGFASASCRRSCGFCQGNTFPIG